MIISSRYLPNLVPIAEVQGNKNERLKFLLPTIFINEFTTCSINRGTPHNIRNNKHAQTNACVPQLIIKNKNLRFPVDVPKTRRYYIMQCRIDERTARARWDCGLRSASRTRSVLAPDSATTRTTTKIIIILLCKRRTAVVTRRPRAYWIVTEQCRGIPIKIML